MKKEIVIVTPIFYGNGTGAAIYYQLLVKCLRDHGYKFSIISEYSDITNNSDINKIGDICSFYGVLPTRTGKRKLLIYDIIIYVYQNFVYLWIYWLIKRLKPNIVLVHSSFYNWPGFFRLIMNRLLKDKTADQRFILDVRDVLMPARYISRIKGYDASIVCSENIYNRFINNGWINDLLHLIPVIQEDICISELEINKELEKTGLNQKSYVFYAGLIKESKAVDLLLEAFTQFVYPNMPDTALVLAGYIKTENPVVLENLRSEGVKYIGNQNRETVLKLMSGAALCINLSPNESLSRFSLEALALGVPTLLPPNIPEYERACPEFVVSSMSPDEIGRRIIAALNNPKVPIYPLHRHLPEKVVKQYETVFQG